MRPLIPAFLRAFSLPAGAEIPRPESIEETLIILYEALKSGVPEAEVRLNQIDMSVETSKPGGNTLVSYPDNLFLVLQSVDASDRQTQVDLHVDAVKNALSRSAVGADDIDPTAVLPVVRDIRFKLTLGEGELPFRPLVGDLFVFWVADRAESMAFLDHLEVKKISGSLEETAALAEKNLTLRLPALTHEPLGQGVSGLVLDGVFESSFLLHAPIWQELDERLDKVVVAAPARDLIFYGDGADPGALTVLRQLAKQGTVAYPLTKELLLWTETGWEVLPE